MVLVEGMGMRGVLFAVIILACSIGFIAVLTPYVSPSLSDDRNDGSSPPMKATDAPESKGVHWQIVGPGGGGWIQSVAFDPKDPNIIYVGCDVGGFYVSFDFGKTFEVRNNGLRDYFVECIAVHPQNTNIILLGTQGGIFRTTDKGKTWQWMRNGFPPTQRYSYSAPIGAICFDPQNPNIVYAGIGRPRNAREGRDGQGQGAIYKSTDGGISWHRIDGGQLPKDAVISDIEVKPDDSNVILVATNRGLFRSDDGGKTWQPSNSGLPHEFVQEIAFAPSQPNRVYLTLLTTAREGQTWNGGVYRSDDAGKTWQSCTGNLPQRVGPELYRQSNYGEIVVDPRNADVVYVGGRSWWNPGVYKTVDGGRTWQWVTIHDGKRWVNMDYGWITFWGCAVECLAISPAHKVRSKPRSGSGVAFQLAPYSSRLVFGTSGHLFVTDDGGKTWQQRYCVQFPDGRFRGNGLEVTCVNDIVPDPVRKGRVYFCYADIGLLISDDGGKTFWRSHEGMKAGGNCFTVVVDPKRPNTIWAATGQWAWNEGYICRSDDGGKTWRVVGEPATGLPSGQVWNIVLDLSSHYKARSEPQSVSEVAFQFFPTALHFVSCLTTNMADMTTKNERRLLVTVNGHGFFESRDGGLSWRDINGNLPAEAAKQPRGILLNPRDSNHIIVACAGTPETGAGIYETKDGGKSWYRLNTDPIFANIQCITSESSPVPDPKSPVPNLKMLYVAAREFYDHATKRLYLGGIFKSTDGGRTWQRILDYHFVSDIVVHPRNPNIIYAATNDHPYHDDCMAEGVLKSDDGGRTWRKVNSGLSHLNISCLAIDLHEPTILYTGTGGNSAFVGKDLAVAERLGASR